MKGHVMRTGFVLLLTFILTSYASAQEGLNESDCIKCHPQVVKEVKERGAKHKTEVGCMDCHDGHPPIVSKEEIIPKCSNCHTDEPHYALANCQGCHNDPHAPLAITLKGDLKEPCISCHTTVGKEMEQNPSLHADLYCNKCHIAHRDIPDCLACHESHSEQMDAKSCRLCHPAHRPTVITYKQDTPNSYCVACHNEEGEGLAKTETKHRDLSCVYCHKNVHGVTPTCETCHGIPHSQRMMARFPKCVECHLDAHNLE